MSTPRALLGTSALLFAISNGAIVASVDYQLTPRRTKAPARYPNAIRSYRIERGLSQTALAARVGGSRSQLSAWERGRTLPTLPHALSVARELSTLAERLYWDLYRPPREKKTPDDA